MKLPPLMRQAPDHSAVPRSVRTKAARRLGSCMTACALALIAGCSNDDALIKTTAGYPPVAMKPSDLPTFAVGDSFTFDNPTETWTVAAVRDGLVTWRSSRGALRKTVFEPFMPPIEWTAPDRSYGEAQLTAWGDGLFPLKGGLKTEFRTRARRSGENAATAYEWKCYSGNPRKVKVEAGSFAAYPVFCRRSDGQTVQSFYAPEVNASLMTTRRKRPAPPETRELVSFKLAEGQRIAATRFHGLPPGVALAAVDPSVRPEQPTATALADVRGGTPAPAPQAGATSGPAAPAIPAPPSPPAGQAQAAGRTPPASSPAAVPTAAPKPPPASAPSAEPARMKPPPAAPPTIAAPVANSSPPPAVAKPAPPASGPPAFRPPAVDGAPAPPTIAPPPLIAPAAPAGTVAVSHPAPVAAARSQARPTADADTPKPDVRPPAGGGYAVQIASYRDPENVERGWAALRQRHQPLLNEVGHVVTAVDLGQDKGVFHRLLAGPFPARSAAEQLCRSIRGRGAVCLVQSLDG